MRDSAKYGDLTADDLCSHEGGRTITTQGSFAYQPAHAPGTALLLCDDCGWTLGYAPTKDELVARQAAADALANCTGSVLVTDTVEQRDARTGQLVTLSSVPSRPLAQRQADLAAARLAEDEAAANAARDEAEAQLERAVVFASFDVERASEDARRAGLEQLADHLAGIATTLRDAMSTSFVPEGTCF